MIQMTYEKRNGDLIQRTIGGYSPYRVGDTNSYGWKVTDIKYLYNKKWYSKSEYDKLVDKNISKSRLRIKVRNTFRNLYNQLSHIILILVLLRVYEIVSSV